LTDSEPLEPEANPGERKVRVQRVTEGHSEFRDDVLAVEEPLEIRVVFGPNEKRRSKSLSITMRTPGHDFELAAGFLLSENIVRRPAQIRSFEHVGPALAGEAHGNTLMVELAPDVPVDLERLQRHFYTTSSCGVCGKASLAAVEAQGVSPLVDSLVVDASVIFDLPNGLRKQQSVFDRTGGLHAAGLGDASGKIHAIREDVGRHNAVDKLVGSQMLTGNFPLAGKILVVSGRASFELIQKALMASIPMLVAVGAPSSLAVELAETFNITLIGFTSEQRFNVYAGGNRIGQTASG
jgi:FdhD protein